MIEGFLSTAHGRAAFTVQVGGAVACYPPQLTGVTAMEWVLFALIAILGLEHITDRIRERRRESANKDKPICGCTHHHAYHDPRTGVCKGTVRRSKGLDNNFNRIYTYHDCNCQQYSGPMPEIDYRIIGELYGNPVPPAPTDPKE